jgi:hypothetical protein
MSVQRVLSLVVLAPLLVVACAGTSSVNPLGAGGQAGADSGVDAAGAAGSAGEASVPPAQTAQRVRTVEQRNPYGHTDIKNNLMVDGDFEFTGASGQYGWYAIANGQQAELQRETGGLCHSGVACGVMTLGTDFLGQAAAPPNQSIKVSLWIKPPNGDCNAVNASLIECSVALPIVLSSLKPVASTPDATGWCHLEGTQSPMQVQPCLYLKTSVDHVLVDDASLVGVQSPGTGATALAATVPSPELYARVKRALDWVHRHMVIGRAAPGRP